MKKDKIQRIKELINNPLKEKITIIRKVISKNSDGVIVEKFHSKREV